MKMPVLIVDDYATMLRIVKNLLKQIGFENVDEATDGGAALHMMKLKKYGLVISDWNMQPVTGIEFLRNVRADADLKGTPFIMVTAESKTDNVIEARNAGVSNYIVKPFSSEILKGKSKVFSEKSDLHGRCRKSNLKQTLPSTWTGLRP